MDARSEHVPYVLREVFEVVANLIVATRADV
jgi:hypothetical protein